MEVSSLWACMLTLKIQAFYSDLECGNFRVYAHVLETSWSHQSRMLATLSAYLRSG